MKSLNVELSYKALKLRKPQRNPEAEERQYQEYKKRLLRDKARIKVKS